MDIGGRIKALRLACQLPQRELAGRVGVSATAISKYERNMDVPGSRVLIKLAEVLDAPVEAFFRGTPLKLGRPQFRCKEEISEAERTRLSASVSDWLERYLELELLAGAELAFRHPAGFPYRVTVPEAADEAAKALRDTWNLGRDAIKDLTGLLESKGVKISADMGEADAVTFRVNDSVPVIVVNRDKPGDRQRFSLAHDLGHLVMQVEGLNEEKMASRFAAAFLVPTEALWDELGRSRERLDIGELFELKFEYGVSMQVLLHRAHDMGIVTSAYHKQEYERFREHGWLLEEPGRQYPPEVQDRRMRRIAFRAIAEGAITESRAAELLRTTIRDLRKEWEAEENTGRHAAVCM